MMGKPEILEQLGELSEQMMDKSDIWDSPETGTLAGWHTIIMDIYSKIQNELTDRGEFVYLNFEGKMKTKYKYIVTMKTAKGYDCHLPLGTYMGYFFTIGDQWFFHDEHSWGDSDRYAARNISKRWTEIADFLGQLNDERIKK